MATIWHFSDTHGFNKRLTIPENIDIAIFSGDCSNPKDLIQNEREVRDFIDWYSKVPIKNKIFVAGNHDVSIEKGWVKRGDFIEKGIIYLENDFVIVEKMKIWGSPVTPNFGLGWAWNMDRAKIHRVWDEIPEDTDILVVHGPPKHILDYTYRRDGVIDACGCSALRKKVFNLNPSLCLFGHIHDCKGISNSGTMKIAGLDTLFSNGTCVMDGRFDLGIIHNGNVLEGGRRK
jgi:Icc-related predicted phosphoesterase